MTVKKGDTVFVRYHVFHHDELPGIVVAVRYPLADVLVIPDGNPAFFIKDLKEIEYSDETSGFYEPNRPYPNRPVSQPEPEEESESETDEEAEEDREGLDSEGSVEEPKARTPARRKR